MTKDYTQEGLDLFPDLEWTLPKELEAGEGGGEGEGGAGVESGGGRNEGKGKVKGFLLVVEDVDAPLPVPITHGIYYNIPPERRSISDADIQPLLTASSAPLPSSSTPASSAQSSVQSPSQPSQVPLRGAAGRKLAPPIGKGSSGKENGKTVVKNDLAGGFKHGLNIRSAIYGGPRPLKGHGPHRYYFQLVALSAVVGLAKAGTIPTKKELSNEIKGKVLGWGEWVGVCERKWGE